MSRERARVVQGADADRLLADAGFVGQWRDLASVCPWSTGFQSPQYALAWYHAFRADYEPVLVVRGGGDHPLEGLLLLARGRQGLVHVGGAVAEYQVWICLPHLAEVFPDQAFDALGAESVVLRYIPSDAPIAWFEGSRLAERAHRSIQVRPLMRTNQGDVERSLRKKSNRSRLNRLKRVGPVRMERVTSPAALEAVFDRIIDQYDIRYGATFNTPSFRSQPARRRFYMELMRHPEVLHLTVLWAGEHIAAAHLGILSRGELQLGFVAFHPRLGRQSPGKLMLLLLGQTLGEEGTPYLDLTPGNDSYKERFATEHDEVSTLEIYRDRSHRLRVSTWHSVADAARWSIRQLGLQPRDVRERVEALHPSRVLAEARRRVRFTGQGRLYEHDLERVPTGRREPLPRNDLRQLLAYQPDRGGPSRQRFLATAMEQFERKAHCYTVVRDDRLLAVTWLTPVSGPMDLPMVDTEWHFEEGSALITTQAFGPAAFEHSIRAVPMAQILADAARLKSIQRVYAVMPGLEEDDEWLHEHGFIRLASFSTTIRFGVQPA